MDSTITHIRHVTEYIMKAYERNPSRYRGLLRMVCGEGGQKQLTMPIQTRSASLTIFLSSKPSSRPVMEFTHDMLRAVAGRLDFIHWVTLPERQIHKLSKPTPEQTQTGKDIISKYLNMISAQPCTADNVCMRSPLYWDKDNLVIPLHTDGLLREYHISPSGEIFTNDQLVPNHMQAAIIGLLMYMYHAPIDWRWEPRPPKQSIL